MNKNDPNRKEPTYLNADGEEETCLREDGEGLIVGSVPPIVPHRVMQGCVGDEEQHQGAVGSVENTFEEGLLAEIQVELTGNVELRMLKTPPVVHILTSRGRHFKVISYPPHSKQK